ncbi:hypothetical protein [Streptomyces sp. NPDC059215]
MKTWSTTGASRGSGPDIGRRAPARGDRARRRPGHDDVLADR